MRRAVLVVAMLACGGCGSLLDTKLPASTSYVLASAPAASSGVTRSDADLSVGRPDLAPGLDTERIAVLKGRELDYYRGARIPRPVAEPAREPVADSL